MPARRNQVNAVSGVNFEVNPLH